MEPRHVYTTAGGEARRLRNHFAATGEFVVVHEHRSNEYCDGNCPVVNALNEDPQDDLSTDPVLIAAPVDGYVFCEEDQSVHQDVPEPFGLPCSGPHRAMYVLKEAP